ncbi:unnamed protein product [Bemisia tabaci]|uniref:Nucleotide exchange factor Fes1 domain-containing protein n=1 Tax=Bemisia tabaci TaxID=7038 RepID=A0A9P0AIJ8_BEMTA|nr:PREDICTED: hsp70-binding protein 1 [Bemisia tabaci]CAH0393840.1 unnamed protein product [Bemisia tabaci]
MPNADENHTNDSPNTIAGAIEYNVQPNDQVSAGRSIQPRTLQDLLRYSIALNPDGTSASSSALPLDEERKEFLLRALESSIVNVTEELKNAIRVIIKSEASDDPEECEAAFDTLAEFVDGIDAANDFFKLGGFAVFKPCLSSKHDSIRWRAASIIADLTQNNPFCQQHILEAGFIPILLDLISNDPDEKTQTKSLYALSCLMRDNPKSIEPFLENNGLAVLLKATQSPIERLQTKSCFLLSVLCKENRKIRDEMCSMGFIEMFSNLLACFESNKSVEQILAALRELVADNPPALEKCSNPDLQLQSSLMKIKSEHSDSQEYEEEIDHVNYLLQNVFLSERAEEGDR